MRFFRRLQISRIAVATLLAASAGTAPGYELGKDQVCYVVTDAHFDIEYKWTLGTSIKNQNACQQVNAIKIPFNQWNLNFNREAEYEPIYTT